MTDRISSRQRQILELLLTNKAGLSIDEIASALDISRNAVQQHFTSLERDGYIQTGIMKKTAGRPVRTFVLTEAGVNWEDLEVLTEAGTNWTDIGVLSKAGVNWEDLEIGTAAGRERV